MKPLAVLVLAACAAFSPQAATAQTSPDQIYAELAKLPAAERQKRIEDGARREGKLVLIHTMRGNLSVDHIALFKKRFPFLNVELEGDIGSQDAAERLYAEGTAGRPLTDVIHIAPPHNQTLVAKDQVARNPTPAVSALLPPYRGFIDPESRWTPWYWSEHGISYNSRLVPKDKIPTQWTDLCNPFFKGSVSFDPTEDRYLSGLYAIMG